MELAQLEKFMMLPLTKLKKAEWNYKQDNEELSKKLIANMKRNGQIENLLVRQLGGDLYEVVNGNHRMDALLSEGCKYAVCYNLGKISDEEAFRISIETNETKFEVDQVQLAKLIASITNTVPMEDLLASFPYNQEELDNYIKMNSFDWEDFNKQEQTATNDALPTCELHLTLEGEIKERWDQWRDMCTANKEGPIQDLKALDLALQQALGIN